MAVIRRIRRTPALAFGPAEWLPADALDDAYFRVLPSKLMTRVRFPLPAPPLISMI
jgi:hypothetical protein